MIASALTDFAPPTGRWARWRELEPILDQVGIEELRAEVSRSGTGFERRDVLLGALVRIGQTDPSARLVVIALLTPGLRAKVRRFGRFLEPDERWATILAALWEQLGRYDTARRPDHVAANLLWDATGTLLRASRREAAVVDHWAPLDAESLTVASFDPVEAKVLEPAVEAGVLTKIDAALIDATRLRGIGLHDAAALLGLSYEAAKKRRRRAEVVWARWWDPQHGRVQPGQPVVASGDWPPTAA